MIESPCISICQIDRETRRCTGCDRTIDQISRWSKMDSTERQEIMKKIKIFGKK